MNKIIQQLENKIDRQEQYSRRNWILIHGIAENKEENTDQQAIDFINDSLDIKIDEIDIDRSHRIGTLWQDKETVLDWAEGNFCRFCIKAKEKGMVKMGD